MGFASALRHRGFRRLWVAQLVSRLGDGVHEIALVWLVYEVTGDPALLAVTVAASTIPTAAASLPAGSLVDRWNRRRVLVASSLLRGAAVLAIPFVGPGRYLVPVLVAVAVGTGLVQAFAAPARGALIPRLVPEADLDVANALFDLTTSASRLLYVVGGAAVALVGPFAVFYLDAASFLIAAGLLLGVPAAAGRPEHGDFEEKRSLVASVAGDVREGLSFVRAHRVLPSVVALSVLTTLAMAPLAVVLPFYVRATTGGGSVDFGLLYSAIYAGVLLGAVVIGRFDRLTAEYRGPVIVRGVSLIGVTLIAVAVLPSRSPAPLAVAFAALTAFGVAFTVVNTPVRTLVQSAVPDKKRGRVLAVLAAVTLPALPVGALLAGPLLAVFDPGTVLLGEGFALVVAGGLLGFTPLAAAGRRVRDGDLLAAD